MSERDVVLVLDGGGSGFKAAWRGLAQGLQSDPGLHCVALEES